MVYLLRQSHVFTVYCIVNVDRGSLVRMLIYGKELETFLSFSCRVTRRDSPSGFGFELTFRLKKQVGETSPPSWPAELLQSLARYVFQTGRDINKGLL